MEIQSKIKPALLIAAAVFAILAIIFYVSSIQEVKVGYEKMQVANVQTTTFAAACAVLCALNLLAFVIIFYIENLLADLSYKVKNSGGETTTVLEKDSSGRDVAKSFDRTNSWQCPKCKTLNPKSRIECKECGTIRS
jgi:hypothetical protein